ncbi:MAG: GIY-YIG nuclease family protein [Rhizomicrobium sp.]
MSKLCYVYIMASQRNGTLYIGVTNNLVRRRLEHREGLCEGFTHEHNVKHLVHYEIFEDVHAAIHREKRLKKWRRQWKVDLIQASNVEWNDLYEQMIPPQPTPDWLIAANASTAPNGR